VGKFVALRRLSWMDAHGVSRSWESAERVGDFRAVMIIPWLMPSRRLALIKQFRPPARNWVVEFPAGLLEDGEDPAAGAARELREETGYRCSDITVYPSAYTSPGLSNETVYLAVARINETSAENLEPRTDFDPGEMIQTVLVDHEDLFGFYWRECGAGSQFDCKLGAFLIAAASLGPI
jgi:8-oxo-dGTP pyrophosphatase MutT (NUDIX family)